MNSDRRSPCWSCGTLTKEIFDGTRRYYCTECQVQWADTGGKSK